MCTWGGLLLDLEFGALDLPPGSGNAAANFDPPSRLGFLIFATEMGDLFWEAQFANKKNSDF
jgi:hypothetical protein